MWISLALKEGKNREVRRVLLALGLKVNRLIRIAYGPFALTTVESGHVEEVGPRVIREQLAQDVRPENVPTGDAIPKPLKPAPTAKESGEGAQRRGGGPKPRKGGAKAKGAEPEAPKVYKAGWAKPKPKPKIGPGRPKRRPGKAAKPR